MPFHFFINPEKELIKHLTFPMDSRNPKDGPCVRIYRDGERCGLFYRERRQLSVDPEKDEPDLVLSLKSSDRRPNERIVSVGGLSPQEWGCTSTNGSGTYVLEGTRDYSEVRFVRPDIDLGIPTAHPNQLFQMLHDIRDDPNKELKIQNMNDLIQAGWEVVFFQDQDGKVNMKEERRINPPLHRDESRRRTLVYWEICRRVWE